MEIKSQVKHEKKVADPITDVDIPEPKIDQDFDYSPLEKDFREKLRKASINRENAENLLALLRFLNNTLSELKDLKFFCYGPAINGMTT